MNFSVRNYKTCFVHANRSFVSKNRLKNIIRTTVNKIKKKNTGKKAAAQESMIFSAKKTVLIPIKSTACLEDPIRSVLLNKMKKKSIPKMIIIIMMMMK